MYLGDPDSAVMPSRWLVALLSPSRRRVMAINLLPATPFGAAIELNSGKDVLYYCFTRLWTGEQWQPWGEEYPWFIVTIHFFVDENGILYVVIFDPEHKYSLVSVANKYWFDNSMASVVSPAVDKTITQY
jgi:hypothetical protein